MHLRSVLNATSTASAGRRSASPSSASPAEGPSLPASRWPRTERRRRHVRWPAGNYGHVRRQDPSAPSERVPRSSEPVPRLSGMRTKPGMPTSEGLAAIPERILPVAEQR
jgi:hypothetical protein